MFACDSTLIQFHATYISFPIFHQKYALILQCVLKQLGTELPLYAA
jgi:hypothetical protein